MNYLAHLLLSGNNLDTQVGGLLGDFVKGPLTGSYPATIEQGIHLHRKIDAITAHLPQITELYPLFDKPWRRYAGIVIDIAFDHLLARRWHLYHAQSLDDFCTTFYQHLARHQQCLPERALRFSQRAPQAQWLEGYVNPDLMPTILARVGEKLRRPVPLDKAWYTIVAHSDHFDRAFSATMTELISFAENYIADNQAPVDVPCIQQTTNETV